MSELKTQVTAKSVKKFIESVENEGIRQDCRKLLKIFKSVTRSTPKIWGKNIVGYGAYHYKSKSGSEGEWMMTGFSPKSKNLSLYIIPGFKEHGALLGKLGKHKTSAGCLYIKRLSDVDEKTLADLIGKSFQEMKDTYPNYKI